MATHRIFCYNPTGATISGTEQVGSIAAATGDVSIDPTKQWWNGPDEDVRYIVAYSSLNSERSNGPERVLATNYPCNLGFIGSSAKTDESFLNLAKTISGSSSLASASAAKTWLNTNGYWTSWSIPPFTGLLDTYSNAAVAYSAARRLSGSYSGSLIRVRRSSDNTEQDIGYDESNVLDQTALTTFVGAGNGFVTIWYDQSGNNKNATQTTAIRQPKIVSNGNLLLKNGKPNINFVNQMLNIGTTVNIANVSYITTVGNSSNIYTSTTTGFWTYQSDSPTSSPQIFMGAGNQGDVINVRFDAALTFSPSNTGFATNKIHTIISAPADTMSIYGNNTLVGTATKPVTSSLIVRSYSIGGYFFTDSYRGGDCQEFIQWNNDKSTNRTDITTNINTFYSIY